MIFEVDRALTLAKNPCGQEDLVCLVFNPAPFDQAPFDAAWPCAYENAAYLAKTPPCST